jgi:Tfp pilus assembly protein PilF
MFGSNMSAICPNTICPNYAPFGCRNEQPDSIYLRGLSSFERGDYEKAIIEFTEAIQAEPSDRAFAYLKRATSHEKRGKRDEAIADYRKALTLDHTLKTEVNAAIKRLTARR